MSMRINSLFEHDASMKRVVEESSLSNSAAKNMPSTIYESAPETQEQARKEKTTKSEKGEKGRHRASIACAACRDRRIRVSSSAKGELSHWLIGISVLCRLENGIVRNARGRNRNASFEMMMSGEGKSFPLEIELS
jgi:hypothetical protein